MATLETDVSGVTAAIAAQPAEAATEDVNVLRRKSDDVGWEYGVLVDPNNKDKVKCLFCGHVSSAGIHHLKQHVANVGTAVVKCRKSSEEAKEMCKNSLEWSSRKRREKTARELNLREVNVSRVGDTKDEVTCIGSSEPQKLGPIDKWTRTIDPKATPAEALHQQKINKELWKQRTYDVQQYVARWMYTHAIPFNAINNDEFLQICEAIGQFGPGFEPPSQDHVRGVLLTEEYERTKILVQERDAKKLKNGCSIMTDVWSDRKRRSIMNLVTNCAEGTSFMSSKEMSDVSHTSEVIFELVDTAIEEVGENEVVQVVTDNPASWWRLYGTETPGLQKMAVRILSLTSSSSGCERNWSTFEQEQHLVAFISSAPQHLVAFISLAPQHLVAFISSAPQHEEDH